MLRRVAFSPPAADAPAVGHFKFRRKSLAAALFMLDDQENQALGAA